MNYVSRAGEKLADFVNFSRVDFREKLVLDIGSSTGGFTDFAIKHGANKVIAVEKGTNQLHPILRNNPIIELHEKTDILGFTWLAPPLPDIILIDVSFTSLRPILKHVASSLAAPATTQIIAMLKPQFEASPSQLTKGIIKNSKIRRQIIKDFETSLKPTFHVITKKDSALKGTHGNLERFYLLTLTK